MAADSLSPFKAVLPNELKLIEQCKRGQLESFEPLVKRHQARLGFLAYQILRDQSLAEEAVQTTFVKAWQNIGSFRSQCAFGSWLYRICVHAASDIIRRQARLRESPLLHSDDDQSSALSLDSLSKEDANPGDETVNREMKKLILQALDKLPEEQRLVLILREMQGLDYREIAKVVKCREGTAMSRLFHARRKMRQLLEKLI